MDFEDFREKYNPCSPSDVVQECLLDAFPSFFEGKVEDYYEFRKEICTFFNIHPKYTFERIQSDEREPQSVQMIRDALKPRRNNTPSLLIDKDNKLAIDMFVNLSYEEKRDGTKAHKYRKEGWYEHPHDCLRYAFINFFKRNFDKTSIFRKKVVNY